MAVEKILFEDIESSSELAEHVCKFIKGQTKIVNSVAVAFFFHYLRIIDKIETPKSSFCLIGGRGVGKTETIKRFSEVIDAPVIRVSLANKVPNGVIGTSIAKEIASYIDANSDIDYTCAILHFSYLDSLGNQSSSSLDYGFAIQKELLSFYDKGNSISLLCKENKIIKFPVDDLCICFEGCFNGIEEIVRKRLIRESKIWKDNYPARAYLMRQLTHADIEEYGIIPELISRIGDFTVMNPLTTETLYEILEQKDNYLSVQKKFCEHFSIQIELTEDARKMMVELSDPNEGVCGLERTINTIFKDIHSHHEQYEGKTICMDAQFIERSLFYNQYSNITADFDGRKLKVSSIAQKYGYSEDEIYDIILTHEQYKNKELILTKFKKIEQPKERVHAIEIDQIFMKDIELPF